MKKISSLLFITLVLFCSYGDEPFYFLENGKRIDLKRIPISSEWPVVETEWGQRFYLNGRITAKTEGKKALENTKEAISRNGGKIEDVSCVNETCYLNFVVQAGTDPFKTSETIHRSGSVKWVQPDWKIRIRSLSVTNDPYFDLQWHIPMINLPGGWKYTHGEPYSIVAVLDSGVSIDHPDLKENIIKGKSFAKDRSTGVSPLKDATGYYNNMVAAHGTSVAGVIGAVTDNWKGGAGICGKCSVMPAKLFDYHEQYIEISRVFNAFKWLVDNGAAVINNSWGEVDVDPSGNCVPVKEDNYRKEALLYAEKYGRKGLGTVVVWAAGNSSCDTDLNMNYQNPSILLTGAVNRHSQMPGYSNYGNRLDIVLPDASFSTDIPGNSGFNDSVYPDIDDLDYTNSFTGTSSSAAVASGIAGLIISLNPSISSRDVIQCIKSTAFQPEQECHMEESERKELAISTDPDNPHTKCFGFGVVNVEKTLKMVKSGNCGKPYEGCSEEKDCPVHFKCDKVSDQCVEDKSNPLPRYDRTSSGGCSLLFIH